MRCNWRDGDGKLVKREDYGRIPERPTQKKSAPIINMAESRIEGQDGALEE
jgi:hypothetical protein